MGMDKTTEQALNALRNAKAKSFLQPGADESTLKLGNILLNKSGYPDMPEDYAFLLTQACGIMGPYFSLFGIGAMKTAGDGLLPSILQASEAINALAGDDTGKFLVLGKMSGGATLLFRDGKYHVVDESTLDVFRTYDAIADFITDTVSLKDKTLDAAQG